MAQFVITSTVAAGPTPLSSVVKNCRNFTLIAAQTLEGPTASPNTGLVKVGNSAVAAEQPIEFNPGDERGFAPRDGGMYDLSQYYFTVATDGDGLVVVHF
jgi:hypothetical protein